VPVLAHTLEESGLSTILVTMMPVWAEKIGVPRTLAVEFPFGQTIGQASDQEQQMRVLRQALEVLETAVQPGEIVHSRETWPVPVAEASRAWQPKQPSPVIAELGPKIRTLLRQRRSNQPG
jgi:hypothetical protein